MIACRGYYIIVVQAWHACIFCIPIILYIQLVNAWRLTIRSNVSQFSSQCTSTVQQSCKHFFGRFNSRALILALNSQNVDSKLGILIRCGLTRERYSCLRGCILTYVAMHRKLCIPVQLSTIQYYWRTMHCSMDVYRVLGIKKVIMTRYSMTDETIILKHSITIYIG